MSLKSLLNKIWKSIKTLFDNFPANIKAAIHLGVVITENIKKITDSPLADILTAIIPGDLDDKVKQALRNSIPIILINLKLADECSELTNKHEVTKCAIKVLQSLDGEVKNIFLHNLSVLIAQLLADGELSWSDGIYLAEWYYQNKFKSLQR